jgi:hypothetical protein
MLVSTLAEVVGICVGFCCVRSQMESLLYIHIHVYNTIKEEGVRTGVLHWKLKLTNTIYIYVQYLSVYIRFWLWIMAFCRELGVV